MIPYSPGQRYAVGGKSGSGKTVYICILAASLVPWQIGKTDWQCWWIDTKHDPDDMAMLRKWGFLPVGARGATTRRIFELFGSKESVYEQAQMIARLALETGGVLLVFDEYGHVCKSTVDAGPYIDDVHKRGRGLDVGAIGGIQELAYVPRALFSQANHLALFSFTHARDVKIARELNTAYAPDWPRRPDTVPHRHGFWLKYLDGYGDAGRWAYHRNVRQWHDSLDRAA